MNRGFTPSALVVAALLVACAGGPPLRTDVPPSFAQTLPEQPEARTGYIEKPGWATKSFAVAAANPLATEAGYQMIKAGGSAVDAAIAVQMVLALVEPQSSGIGGGALMLHWNGRQVEAFDGREVAPAAVDDKLFLRPDGKPMAFQEAVVGGRSVGVPGAVRMLEMAHRQYGKLAWSQLFQPAIRLAEGGFAVSPRLYGLLRSEQRLQKDPAASSYFFKPDGNPRDMGSVLRNPALAAVLRSIADRGSRAFYSGSVAQSIVAKVQRHPTNPGKLTEQDISAYQPKKREAMCNEWHRYRLCGFPPPSSGHIAIMQMLGILDRAAVKPGNPIEGGLPSADFLHNYTEAARLAFADRGLFVADPDFVQPPAGRWDSLLDDAYLRQRAALIGPQSMRTARPGTPAGAVVTWGEQAEQVEYGTSHISIVDPAGNAIAMTSTIEDQFGSRQLVDGGTGLAGGFLLNNQLTDFSFAPTDAQGKPIANRVQPGKRPRSSVSPELVFDKATGQLVMSVGSPGGAMIIHYTAKALIGTLEWGLNAQRAIDLPNFGSTNGPTLLEQMRFPSPTVNALKARGHDVREVDLTSGLQAIQRTRDGWFGGADPRREGIVRGD